MCFAALPSLRCGGYVHLCHSIYKHHINYDHAYGMHITINIKCNDQIELVMLHINDIWLILLRALTYTANFYFSWILQAVS